MSPIIVILALAVAAGIAIFAFGVAERSVATPELEFESEPSFPQAGPQNPREALTGAMDALNRLMTSRPQSSKIADNLARADIKLRVSEYAMMVAAATVGLFLFSYVINHNLIVSLIFGVLGYFIPGFYVRYRQRQRFKALNTQL